MANNKLKKDILIVASALFAVIVAVMGWHWTDTANKSFWWTFWVVAAVVCLAACLAGWAYLNVKSKRK